MPVQMRDQIAKTLYVNVVRSAGEACVRPAYRHTERQMTVFLDDSIQPSACHANVLFRNEPDPNSSQTIVDCFRQPMQPIENHEPAAKLPHLERKR